MGGIRLSCRVTLFRAWFSLTRFEDFTRPDMIFSDIDLLPIIPLTGLPVRLTLPVYCGPDPELYSASPRFPQWCQIHQCHSGATTGTAQFQHILIYSPYSVYTLSSLSFFFTSRSLIMGHITTACKFAFVSLALHTSRLNAQIPLRKSFVGREFMDGFCR